MFFSLHLIADMGLTRDKISLCLGIVCMCMSICLSEYPQKKDTVSSVGLSTDEDPFLSWLFNPRWTDTGMTYRDSVIHIFGEGADNEQIDLLLPSQGLDEEKVSSAFALFPFLPPTTPPIPVPSSPPLVGPPPSPSAQSPCSLPSPAPISPSPPISPSISPPPSTPPSPTSFTPSTSPLPTPYPFPPSPTIPSPAPASFPSATPPSTPPPIKPPSPTPPTLSPPPIFPSSSAPSPSGAPPVFPPHPPSQSPSPSPFPGPNSPSPSPTLSSTPSPQPFPSPSPTPTASPTPSTAPLPPKISILTNLTVSNGAKLVPDFSPFIFNYKASFGSKVKRFYVIAYLPEDEEDYKYSSLYIESVPLKAGEESPPLKLGKKGETATFHIHVRAINHASSTYMLSVTREGHKGLGAVVTIFVVLACIVGAIILLVLGYTAYVYARTGRMLQLRDFQFSRDRGSSLNTPLLTGA